jgi:DNA helicase II / ATP-dependent DNA helicase PcrA
MNVPARFVGDFHIHSHYSMATSGLLVPAHLDLWARNKGISVVGTGDFTHPGWLAELRETLVPAEAGLYRLKDGLRLPDGSQAGGPVRFLLTAEISTIYAYGGRTRKVHHVLLAPDFAAVERVQESLGRIGNITSDGRPILGIDSRDLLEITLEACPDIFFVPAHVWTPWFSALGSRSGFDSIEECYRDLARHISAIETGLSSDPPMNWACSILDRYTLISNSDAHSPEKLGREANLLACEMSYRGITDALRTGDPARFLGTIEFFPEEGKYHFDGHRKCGVCLDPVETARRGGICPVCGKPLTVGVASRVAQLADREDLGQRPARAPFTCVVALKELLAEIAGVGAGSRQVARAYDRLVAAAGSELGLLLDAPLADVERWGDSVLREAVRRVRERRVDIEEGNDGDYGRIRVFGDGEAREVGASLFAEAGAAAAARPPRPLIGFDLGAIMALRAKRALRADNAEPVRGPGRARETAAAPAQPPGPPAAAPLLLASGPLDGLNAEQRAAAAHREGPALILAGPGTGKTQTLARRAANLVVSGVSAETILMLTFTNRAAGELRERLAALATLGGHVGGDARGVRVMTFHSFGLSLLRERPQACGRTAGFQVLDEKDSAHLARGVDAAGYRERLLAENAFDFEGLVDEAVAALAADPAWLSRVRSANRWILVDEYQDVNAGQYDLLRLLAPSPGDDVHLCVVGDPDQAIYGFRGADVGYIRRYTEDYPASAVYRLRRSYRCTGRILRASGQVIGTASFLEGLNDGVRLRIVSTPNDRAEADFVARTIARMVGGLGLLAAGDPEPGISSLGDFAVLCRLGRQMEVLEQALGDLSIPCQKVGEEPFLRQEPCRTLLDLVRLALAPGSSLLRERLASRGLEPPAAGAAAAMLAEAAARNPALADEAAVRRLLALAVRCGNDPRALVEAAALGSPPDDWEPRREQVSLLTIHAAKGLEFPCVFVAGCEDGLLPYRLFPGSVADVEEERRLFYVAMTRAGRYLFLTHAAERTLFGRPWHLPRSPFVASIARDLLDEESAAGRERRVDLQLELFG